MAKWRSIQEMCARQLLIQGLFAQPPAAGKSLLKMIQGIKARTILFLTWSWS